MTEALRQYTKTLIPTAPDKALVSARRTKVEAALRASNMTVFRMFETGSHSHGTGIASKSDVDYMVSLADDSRTSLPSSMLAKLKDALAGSDYEISDVRISSPTVQVTYRTGPAFEIVPGFLKDHSTADYIYEIPGRANDWVLSSPESHKAYVNNINDQLGKKVKTLIRLVKAWKHGSGAPVSSFYLEMRTAKYASGLESVNYDVHLEYALRTILGTGLADMNDPTGRVGRIPACASAADRSETTKALTTAIDSLQAAFDHAQGERWFDYWSDMSDVFTGFQYHSGW